MTITEAVAAMKELGLGLPKFMEVDAQGCLSIVCLASEGPRTVSLPDAFARAVLCDVVERWIKDQRCFMQCSLQSDGRWIVEVGADGKAEDECRLTALLSACRAAGVKP